MCVPAGYIGGFEARHILITDDDILQNLIERRTKMNAAVCVRRAVVEHIEGLAFVFLHQFFVYLLFLPIFERFRLAFREPRAHGEFGLGKIERCIIILWHLTSSLPL